MEKNLYNDNRHINVESSMGRQQYVTPAQTQRPESQRPKTAQRMPKAQAQTLTRNLKKTLAVASVLGFGAFSGLIAYQQVNAATTTTTTTQSSTKSSQSNSNSNSSSFFNQQGETNVGSNSTSSSSQNSNSASSTTAATPVTGTSVS